MDDTPDPNNPKPGDRFRSRSKSGTLTVRYVDDDFVFGVDGGGNAWSQRRHLIPVYFTPAPPVWPEPPVLWGVQFRDGDVWRYDHEDGARREIADCEDGTARLIEYTPKVVE
jgi:hypothetical protein